MKSKHYQVIFSLRLTMLLAFPLNSHEQPLENPDLGDKIKSILSDKSSRSIADQKISSSLLQARDALAQDDRGEKRLKDQSDSIQDFIKKHVDSDSRIKIVIHTSSTHEVMLTLKASGATDLNASDEYQMITARVFINTLSEISKLPEVQSIEPFIAPRTNR